MFSRNGLSFVLSTILLWISLSFVPAAYVIFEKSSSVLVGLVVALWISRTIMKIIFNKKLKSDNKAIFITGCDSGFGYELVKRMDKAGYKVFAGCFNAKGEGAINLLETCTRVSILPLDVRCEKSIQEAKRFVVEHLEDNVLWAVVNNAGVPQAGEMEWTSMEDIQAVYNVNTLGTIRITKAFLHIIRKYKGRIINNTSAVGRFICPGFVGYCMSKSAIIAFTEGLRTEMLKWGVKVISIEPFFYKTPLTSEQTAIELAEKTWSKADPDIRHDYGEDYLESFKASCHRTVNLSSSKVYEVIDCFEDAIAAEEPLSVYFPAYLPHKLGILLLRLLPSFVQENYQRLYLERDYQPLELNK